MVQNSYNNPIFTSGTVSYSDLDLTLKPNPSTGDIRTKTDIDSVKQSIRNLLLTRPGDFPFIPDLGSGVQTLLFEQLDQITKIRLTNAIVNTITTYEPRVSILDLTITEDLSRSALNVGLKLLILNVAEPQTISVLLYRVR